MRRFTLDTEDDWQMAEQLLALTPGPEISSAR